MKETLWGGTVPAPTTKRKAATQKQKAKGKRVKPVAEEEESVEEDSDSETEKAVPEGRVHAKAKVPRPAPPGSNAWATKARVLLSKGEYGSRWTELVGAWWAREEGAGFAGTNKAHPAKKRPTQIKDWVGRARNPNFTPEIPDVEEYGEEWWGWWVDINPAWRQKKRPMKRGDGPSWACLDINGQNGFLNVLVGLKWWRDELEEGSPDWEEAVDDVTWVLQQMKEYVALSPTLAHTC
ncbi:hypothetical protein DFH06DRAFT_999755 [Mycena polygramma]|nr:hypothetical protein DFH06DRAFT_999755 [Mycena polygramma]